MNVEQKKRTRKLIGLGGLIVLAGIEKQNDQELSPEVLLGLLLEAKKLYVKKSDDEIRKLQAEGATILETRRKQKEKNRLKFVKVKPYVSEWMTIKLGEIKPWMRL